MTAASIYADPPFRITRTSHVHLTSRDPDAAANFYTELAGMVVSLRDSGAVWLRGVEETCHHSLVLRKSDDNPTCDAIGFRVLLDRDLDAAHAYFERLGVVTRWVEREGEKRTLAVQHTSGIPFELVAEMERMPRVLTDYRDHRGGRALRIDHFQALVPEVATTGDAFLDMGFRAAEMIVQSETGRRLGMFLHRKNNPHDLVLAQGAGPRLHHFAFVVADLQAMVRACDIAGVLGVGTDVERGPGRHGPGNGMFTYFRDPDGHRLELILPPMQFMDAEEETRIWTSAEKNLIVPWGPPASKRWLEEATHFTGVALSAEGDLARWSSR